MVPRCSPGTLWLFPQSDLPSAEEHLFAPERHVIPLGGVANFEPLEVLGVFHAPLMCVPLDAMQHDSLPFLWPTCDD